MTMRLNRDLGNSFQVLGIRRNHDVQVLRASDDSPGVYREAAD